MRSLEDARESWQTLKQYQSLRDLKDAVRLDGNLSLATGGCRSACWKAFLLFDTVDTSAWTRTLLSSRSAYNSLRAHFMRHLEDTDQSYDPLSEDTESSQWIQFHKDEELRQEIQQDVTRCMPENLYFRQPDTQRILLDVLFIYCKLNPDVSYRQGMHELLAPILWVVEREAIDLGQSSKALGEDAVIKTVFDADHVEHDTFALFGEIMQSAKNFYEQTTVSGKENPIAARSRRIFGQMLPLVDAKLAKHLESIDIVPQVFLIRWIRLLFGREFTFDATLTVWDILFAEDATLEIVDHICIAMLLRIRWDLIEADYNAALTLLLRYPDSGADFVPQTLALDALYLREHMNQHGGSHVVSKYTGRPLQQGGRPVTPPALQRSITTFSGPNATKVPSSSPSVSPSRTPRQARNIEAVLQSTAKNIYARGEKLGIGKAVRSAVNEVHRKAQEIQEAQTPSLPSTYLPAGSRSSVGSGALNARIDELENRSRQLAKLLEGAVAELWDYQKSVVDSRQTEQGGDELAEVERLSVATAKVQFVQVYLEDPSLPLPRDESPPQEIEANEERVKSSKEGTDASNQSLHLNVDSGSSYTGPLSAGEASRPPISSPPKTPPSPSQVRGLADPASFEDNPQDSLRQAQEVPKISVQPESNALTPDTQPAKQANTPEASLARPRLEQSSFSWMLGQQETSSDAFSNASAHPPEYIRRNKPIFGDTEAADSIGGKERRVSGKQRKKSNDKGDDNDGAFDLGSLRHGRVKNAGPR